jgi:hypothetical protein
MQIASATYRTTSFYATAFLLSNDLPLVDVVRDHEGRAEFLIGGDPADVETLVREYRRGTATVNARRFGDELRRVKGLLFGRE